MRQATVTLLPPIPRPPLLRDFMAFETHLKNIYPRLGREIPPEWYNLPIYYKGNSGSLGTHGQDVPIPSWADALDYEFELAMVIGKAGKDIPREQAMDHVFGFMIYNDFSERGIQGREMSVGLGPAKGKDFHNAHVFGPYLVTRDEIADPYNLRMTSRLNGAGQLRRQLGHDALEVRGHDRPRLDVGGARGRRDLRLRHRRQRLPRRARGSPSSAATSSSSRSRGSASSATALGDLGCYRTPPVSDALTLAWWPLTESPHRTGPGNWLSSVRRVAQVGRPSGAARRVAPMMPR